MVYGEGQDVSCPRIEFNLDIPCPLFLQLSNFKDKLVVGKMMKVYFQFFDE